MINDNDGDILSEQTAEKPYHFDGTERAVEFKVWKTACGVTRIFGSQPDIVGRGMIQLIAARECN